MSNSWLSTTCRSRAGEYARAAVYPNNSRSGLFRLSSRSCALHDRLAVTYRMTRKQLLEKLIGALEAKTASPKKQAKSSKSASAAPSATTTASKSLDELITDFNNWFLAGSPPVAKILAAPAPDGMRLGTFAVEDISPEEVYLSVPQALIMDVASAMQCVHVPRAFPVGDHLIIALCPLMHRSSIAPLLKKLRERFPGGDAFHELLFHLMNEHFELPQRGEASFWKPYLDTIPTAAEMDHPVFYSAQELAELKGSSTKLTIERYQAEVNKKYTAISKLMQEYPGVSMAIVCMGVHSLAGSC